MRQLFVPGTGVDELRLEVALKMLKTPHFNAKMNSLKEVIEKYSDYTVSLYSIRSSSRLSSTRQKGGHMGKGGPAFTQPQVGGGGGGGLKKKKKKKKRKRKKQKKKKKR